MAFPFTALAVSIGCLAVTSGMSLLMARRLRGSEARSVLFSVPARPTYGPPWLALAMMPGLHAILLVFLSALWLVPWPDPAVMTGSGGGMVVIGAALMAVQAVYWGLLERWMRAR